MSNNLPENNFFEFSDEELREVDEATYRKGENTELVVRSSAELVEKGFEYVGDNEDLCYSTFVSENAYALCEQELYSQENAVGCYICSKDYIEALVKDCNRFDVTEEDILPIIYIVQDSFSKVAIYRDNYVGNNPEDTEAIKKQADDALAGRDDETFIREVIASLVSRFGAARVLAYFTSNHEYSLLKLFDQNHADAKKAMDDAIFELEYDYSLTRKYESYDEE